MLLEHYYYYYHYYYSSVSLCLSLYSQSSFSFSCSCISFIYPSFALYLPYNPYIPLPIHLFSHHVFSSFVLSISLFPFPFYLFIFLLVLSPSFCLSYIVSVISSHCSMTLYLNILSCLFGLPSGPLSLFSPSFHTSLCSDLQKGRICSSGKLYRSLTWR